jgi:hypothetical protein
LIALQVCGSSAKVAEACNKISNCVAFTYEFGGSPACGYLKYATKMGRFREGWMTFFKEPKAAGAKMVTSGRK